MTKASRTKILNKLRKLFMFAPLEKVLRKLVAGRSPRSLIGRLVPNNYQYPKDNIRKFIYKGILLELDIHDYIGHYLYFGFRDEVQQELVDFAGKGDIFLDVGTNIGSTLLQFAKNVGENGKVFGFEPDPLNFRICQRNIALNKLGNVVVSNIALGNKKSKLKLVVDTETNRGGNRILDEANGKEFSEVNVLPLDEWIKEHPLDKLNFIKIDVEGFELNVLHGAVETLKKFSPGMFIELDDRNLKLQGQSAKELVAFLNGIGYATYHSVTKQMVFPEENFTNCHYDLLAIRK